LSASGTAQNRILISMHKQNQVAIIAAFGAILNLLLNFALIPLYSYVGAAIATITTRVVIFGITFYLVSKSLSLLPLHKIIFKPLISCALMGVFLLFSDGINLAGVIITGIVIYFASFILIKGFNSEDRELITRTIRKQ
jgi:O-antigen/teichoic acid export membrane protein